MITKAISQMTACSHYHFFNPFCPRQTSSQKVANIFFYALGAAAIWFSYQALQARTNSGTTQRGALGPSSAKMGARELFSRPIDLVRPLKPDESTIATLIPTENDIDRLAEMVGVSLDTIQKRAKPSVNSGETAKGFIQESEFIVDVIRKDWKVAKAANVTHIEIADHLNNIVETARKQPGKPVSYDWTTKSSVASEQIPRFLVVFQKKKDDMIETDIFRSEGVDRLKGLSNEEALIMNPAIQGSCIRWTSVREDYICKYGFYAVGTELKGILDILKAKPLVISD